jgi:SnoaL-like polyketide cyclase
MRSWKYLVPLLLGLMVLVASTLACSVEDAIFGFATETPYPTNPFEATMKALQNQILTAMPTVPFYDPNFPPKAFEAAWEGNPDQMSNVYAPGSIPTAPFSQLFGTLDQIGTMKSLKNAIPDLKFNWRMTVVQNNWAAWSFDISGQFTQPLVTANGTIAPTNNPWFTTVQMLVRFTPDGKIAQEYSSADMVAMMHDAGIAGFQNVSVGNSALEKPMTAITPSTDPAAGAAAEKLTAAVSNGPFFMWLPGDVPTNLSTKVTYHSPYGDAVNKVSEAERKLLSLGDAHVEVPMIVRQGNLIGMAYTYSGTVAFPVKFADGMVLPASNQLVKFSGVVLGSVDAAGNGEAWVMFNRLDNPITTDKYKAGSRVTGQATLPASAVTLTPAAGETTLEPTPSAGTTAACTVTAPQKVNLRKGTGTSFAVGGTLAAGQSAEADGQAQGSDGKTWYHLGSLNLWALSNIVTGDCGTLPEVVSGGSP